MKYLTDYTEDKMTELFNRLGTYFCFSKEQFYDNDRHQKDAKYTNMGSGMVTPSGTEEELINGLDTIHKEARAQDIRENGIRAIIRRELYNHEAFYTWSIESTVDALESYPTITAKDIKRMFYREGRRQNEDNRWIFKLESVGSGVEVNTGLMLIEMNDGSYDDGVKINEMDFTDGRDAYDFYMKMTHRDHIKLAIAAAHNQLNLITPQS